MEDNPLSQLIRHRGFDQFQPGLRSRFQSNRIKYELGYGKLTDNAAMWIDVESDSLLGRMTVWESGPCDIYVFNIETEKQLFWKHYEFKNEREFHQRLADFFLYFRDGKELP